MAYLTLLPALSTKDGIRKLEAPSYVSPRLNRRFR